MSTRKNSIGRIFAALFVVVLALIPVSTGAVAAPVDAVHESTGAVGSHGTRAWNRTLATATKRLSAYQREMVDWAQGRYAAAGLELPPVMVSFPSDREECHGNDGRWEHRDGEFDQVMICITHDKPKVEEEWQRRALVHELAHAWAGATLDEADRLHFLALRGLEAWNDPGDEWGRRGIEHAAEIISWGIIDQQIHMWKLPNASCPAMTAAYRLLTGMTPETGFPESCR